MNVSLRLAGERSFSLQSAILIYGDDRRGFATLHDIIPASDGVPAQLAPGRTVGTAFVKTLAGKLGQSVAPDVLPPNVLVRTSDVLMWWKPASVATLFYHPSEAKNKADVAALKALSGKRFPIPPLVFRAARQGLWVRALARAVRPDATTMLHAAPFYNVGKTGSVCVGSMRTPQGRGLETMAQWERAFFESEFTHLLPGVNPTRHAGGFVGLWQELAGAPTFPVRQLAPAPSKQTVAQFAASDKGRDW